MFKKELKLLVLLVAMHCTNANSTESVWQSIININSSSSVTINNIDSQRITYTNSYNHNSNKSVIPQDIPCFITTQYSDTLKNVMQQPYGNLNMRGYKSDNSSYNTEANW